MKLLAWFDRDVEKPLPARLKGRTALHDEQPTGNKPEGTGGQARSITRSEPCDTRALAISLLPTSAHSRFACVFG
jgi:hypothetical protein